MANLNTLFDEIKNTENINPKLTDLLRGLIQNVNTKVGIIVGLQNWVHFLENKVNEMERYIQKIVLFSNIYLYVPEILPKMSWPFLTTLWAWR